MLSNPYLIAVLCAATLFELINGFHDTANAIATTVYTRALTPAAAIAMSATMNFIGALTNDSVAMTVAHGIVTVDLELYVVLTALLGAIAWDLFTWWNGIPSSSSHALIGSLVGATIVFTGSLGTVEWQGLLRKVVIPLFTSPLIGMLLGFSVMHLIFELFATWPHAKANGLFHKAQICSSAFMAYSHGSNDAQKTMGIITLALISGGLLPAGSDVPLWVKIFCATTMAVGQGVTKLEPVLGFVSETSSAIAIQIMTALGAPVSTTQVITTSIMGAGAARSVKKVRWGTAKSIVGAWVLTLPATMALGGAFAFVVGLFM